MAPQANFESEYLYTVLRSNPDSSGLKKLLYHLNIIESAKKINGSGCLSESPDMRLLSIYNNCIIGNVFYIYNAVCGKESFDALVTEIA